MSTEQRATDPTILDYARSVPNHPIHCPICNRKVPVLVLAKGKVTLEPARCIKCLVLTGGGRMPEKRCGKISLDPPIEGAVLCMGDTTISAGCTTRTPQFSTSNLAVAAYLTAGKHLTLNQVDCDSQSVAIFVFDDPDHRGEQFEAAFLTKDALVPGAQFHRQLRVLRRLIQEKQDRNKLHNSNSRIRGYANDNSRRY
jgi:hypothetical protein